MNNREKVYEIFKEFFGEEKVDLQEDIILVHFPCVEVTNESGRSVIITHLFVKTKVEANGEMVGQFTMNRSEYTKEQFESGYAHSHLPHLNYGNLGSFRPSCLGTGPIRHTINSLSTQYDEDLWRLYCYELSLYVTRESLEGGPHIRMESIGTGGRFSSPAWTPYETNYNSSVHYGLYPEVCWREVFKQFYPFVVRSGKIPFRYVNDNYTIALSPYELTITLSNLFIDWYNQLPDDKKPELTTSIPATALWEYMKCRDGKIYIQNRHRGRNRDMKDYVGQQIVRFKGVDYKLNIIGIENEPSDDEENRSILLCRTLREMIVYELLKTINYGFRSGSKITAKEGTFTTILSEDTRVL